MLNSCFSVPERWILLICLKSTIYCEVLTGLWLCFPYEVHSLASHLCN